jgi:hypothetical protein
MLEWVIDGQGYVLTRLEPAGATSGELDEAIRDYLIGHPWSSTAQVQQNVKGTDRRIAERLKVGFDSCPGPRGATRWGIPSGDREGGVRVPEQALCANPHRRGAAEVTRKPPWLLGLTSARPRRTTSATSATSADVGSP